SFQDLGQRSVEDFRQSHDPSFSPTLFGVGAGKPAVAADPDIVNAASKLHQSWQDDGEPVPTRTIWKVDRSASGTVFLISCSFAGEPTEIVENGFYQSLPARILSAQSSRKQGEQIARLVCSLFPRRCRRGDQLRLQLVLRRA